MDWSLLFIAMCGIILDSHLALGLGINCYGSSQCQKITYALAGIANTVCNKLPSNKVYGPGAIIGTSCHTFGGFSAYTQYTSNSITAAAACGYLRNLLDYGCQVCGSIPLYAGNDVTRGELTVNYSGFCWMNNVEIGYLNKWEVRLNVSNIFLWLRFVVLLVDLFNWVVLYCLHRPK